MGILHLNLVVKVIIFFNAGLFNSNSSIYKLGELYAEVIYNKLINNNIEFDCLFGPAYKGIPLATATAIALYTKYDYQTNVAFNRKEAKTHGEGGNIIGFNLENKKAVLIDDVITAGTATRESINLLKTYNAEILALVVALDRQDSAHDANKYNCASDEITAEYNIPVYNIASFLDIVEFTKNNADYTKYAELLVSNI